jgi:hypothetical protein
MARQTPDVLWQRPQQRPSVGMQATQQNTPLLLRVQGYNFMGHDLEPLCVYDNSNVVAFVRPCATAAFLGAKDTVSAAYMP